MSKKISLNEKAQTAKDKASLLGQKAKESGIDEKAHEAKEKVSFLGKKAKDRLASLNKK